MSTIRENDVQDAAMEGYFVADEDDMAVANEDTTFDAEYFGDHDKMSESQRVSLRELKESTTYPRIKVKRIALSFSGASVYFFSPIRKDGAPMPSSVVKLDTAECVKDEAEKTNRYAKLFGLTTPKVKDMVLPDDAGDEPNAVMQIDLCGGVFGLPEFASAPAVLTFASILEEQLKEADNSVDIPPIVNEALERRMRSFTMSGRSVKKTDLTAMYKISRFVGHGILNRATEGAKRAKKSPAIAAGFLNPASVQELDPEGNFMQELVGNRKKVNEFFQDFLSHEKTFTARFERNVVRGLCHNDLHGGNLLLDSQGLVWLIDFATVKENVHVLMDLSKFLASCLFLYLQTNVDETMVRSVAKLLATTPDATTMFPVDVCKDLASNASASLMLDLICRLRRCISSYEVGDDAPTNDGIPFAVAFFSWSARMLSYNEPSLAQKTRALYFSIAFAQRLMWDAGISIGKNGSEWINQFRFHWEGEKARRLSSSATQMQEVKHKFEIEFPRYLAQVGTAESWSTDFLTRERVHVMDHCIKITLKHTTSTNPRLLKVSDAGTLFINKLKPVLQQLLPDVVAQERFCGRVLIVGDSGTGKSTLTKQLFSELAQSQVVSLYKSSEDTANMHQINTHLVPVRVPLIDLARQLEADPDTPLVADPLSDLLAQWMERKHGADSAPYKIVSGVRTSSEGSHLPGRRASVTSMSSRRSSMSSNDARSAGVMGDIRGLFLLLDGLDEANAFVPSLVEYFKSLMQQEPDNVALLTSRPSVLKDAVLFNFSEMSYVSLFVTHLELEQAVEIATRTLVRLRDGEETRASIIKEISDPAYSSLTKIPLILTLLLHVLRKFRISGDPAATQRQVLSKTDVYQRAMRLLLHQSDVAKFQMRDGKNDQAMVRNFEMLKSVRARKFFQKISWEAHAQDKRALTWDEMHMIGKDKELTSVIQKIFEQGRAPIFEKIERLNADPQVQMTHLSFQEMLSGEYSAAIVRYSHDQKSTRPYLNYILSNSVVNADRNRLAYAWWMHVWFHVCEMLPPKEYEEWCDILCEDERAKIGVGTRGYCWGAMETKADFFSFVAGPLLFPKFTEGGKQGWDPNVFRVIWPQSYVLTSVDDETGLCGWKSSKTCCLKQLQFHNDKPVHRDSVLYRCDGVAGLLHHATHLDQTIIMESLLGRGLSPNVMNDESTTAWWKAIRLTSNEGFAPFQRLGFVPGTLNGLTLSRHCILKSYTCSNTAMRHLQGKASRELNETAHDTGVLQKAYAGTLQVTPDLDPNFADPSTQVSILMLAAAGGHHELVRKLLARGARVNQTSREACTALFYAVECSTGTDALLCMEHLISAKGDVNHMAGVSQRHCINIHKGNKLSLGMAACQAGDWDKLDLLIRAGHELNLANEAGRTALHACEESCTPDLGRIRQVRKLTNARKSGARDFTNLPNLWLYGNIIISWLPKHLPGDWASMYFGAGANSVEVVRELLDSKFDVNYFCEGRMCSGYQVAPTTQVGLVEMLFFFSPWHHQGDMSAVNACLEYKWCFRHESRGYKPVQFDHMVLNSQGNQNAIEWILDQKADFNDPEGTLFREAFVTRLSYFPELYGVYTDWLLKQELKEAELFPADVQIAVGEPLGGITQV